ncbi:MAG: succinate dehydrogenase iron-sulfur subunit [Chloroflexi bacterium]|nr:succinate dehydrogenase iron-sulfur subunit [Chloroflexota bacterium]MCL5108364.1 succinate dehydrogenase iron-sulfur subunit [Chloroflexota bacterium]
MKVELSIKRFDPDQDEASHTEVYGVEIEPTDRVLDALNQVKWYQDGTLTYRRSCAHGICGSDAMRINGLNRLACKTLIKELGSKISIEPLLGFTVIKDLMVDFDHFFDLYKSVKPYLINYDPTPAKERLQSPEQREAFDDTTKCILCAACTTSCPPFWSDPNFVGPAALVNAHRFIFDSRDQGGAERLEILNGREGVWRCRTVFNCTQACPRDIKITKAIEQIKRLVLFNRV